MSSGLRINSAKDDAAGLAISQRMMAQVNGLNQATRNASDGTSLSQTAEGALGSMGDALQRIRQLAVQSANSTNSTSDRAALQAEVSQLVGEITRVGNTTAFNGLKILDGSYSGQFQVGANAGETIAVAVGDSRAKALGAAAISTSFTAGAQAGIATTTALNTALVINGQTIANTLVAAGDVSGLVDSINASSGATGVTAARSTNNSIFAGAYTTIAAAADTLTINGATVTLAIGDTEATAATKINTLTPQTGVTYSAVSHTFSVANGGDLTISATAASTAAPWANVTTTATTYVAGVQLSTKLGGSIDTTGSALDTEIGLAAAGAQTLTNFQVSALDVSSITNANQALQTVDFALSQVNSTRASLGAIQSRFDAVVSNLQNASENLTAAKSRITDTDFAAETANLTRAGILQQAGTAMLAQANALPNSVLALLR